MGHNCKKKRGDPRFRFIWVHYSRKIDSNATGTKKIHCDTTVSVLGFESFKYHYDKSKCSERIELTLIIVKVLNYPLDYSISNLMTRDASLKLDFYFSQNMGSDADRRVFF